MIELQDSFQGKAEVSDYSFTRVVSNSTGYVYEITDANNSVHYETFLRRQSKKCVSHIAGKEVTFDAKVKYPISSDFGLWAWCFSDCQKALACYGHLNDSTMPGDYKQLIFDY